MAKIIFLVAYSLFPEFKPSDTEFWASWTKIARSVRKYAPKELSIEVWKPERLLRYPVSFEIGGVIAKMFPSFRWKWLEVCPQLWASLWEVKGGDVVFFLHEYHCFAHWAVINILRNAPIIAQHHGGLPVQKVAKKSRTTWILYKLAAAIEKRTLRKVSHFFVLTRSEKEFITSQIGRPAEIQVDPIDFEKFRPMDKHKCRERLGLSPNKRYLIFVGRFLRVRGADLVIEAFRSLRRKYPDLELLMIGGLRGDELFDLVAGSQAICLGRLPHDLLPYYYSAADLLVAPSRVEGVGMVNVLEALACGTPVVTTLRDLFPPHEWIKIGRVSSVESFTHDLEQVLVNLPSFSSEVCRRVVQKYHSEEKIARRIIEVASELLQKA
jgi:glycosyltransferase involved in cell wall biosynthesis